MKKYKFTYEKSGVNINAADIFVRYIANLNKNKKSAIKNNNIGGFASVTTIPKGLKEPLLISSTDGVGTKIEIAKELDDFSTIGIDLVAMCVNDLIVCSAEPLVFLDYYVTDKLNVETASTVIEGIAKGCELANCSLAGGETAEHPGSFPDNSFDLAGFSLGVVNENEIIGQDGPMNNDILIGIESSGFHSNGFSLLRKVIKDLEMDLHAEWKGEEIGEFLLKPTHIYVSEILALKKIVSINAISHITGGGIYENLERIIPSGMSALIDCPNFIIPDRFVWLKELANIKTKEMLKTFNCGIGLVVIIHHKNKKAVQNFFKKNKINSHVIGEVVSKKSVGNVIIKNFGKWDLI